MFRRGVYSLASTSCNQPCSRHSLSGCCSTPTPFRQTFFLGAKTQKLTHDALASTFRTWKKQFRAYFDSAQLGALPCSQQQAYLCNCVYTVLRARIDCGATGTTPVYSPVVGPFTCIAILDNTFLVALSHPLQAQTVF